MCFQIAICHCFYYIKENSGNSENKKICLIGFIVERPILRDYFLVCLPTLLLLLKLLIYYYYTLWRGWHNCTANYVSFFLSRYMRLRELWSLIALMSKNRVFVVVGTHCVISSQSSFWYTHIFSKKKPTTTSLIWSAYVQVYIHMEYILEKKPLRWLIIGLSSLLKNWFFTVGNIWHHWLFIKYMKTCF